MRRALTLLATLALWPALAGGASTTEYVDPEYGFRFRFPSDWTRHELPVPGEAGTVRVALRAPASPMFVLAIVTPLDPAIPREQVERSPDRDAVVEALIARTLGQVYAKMSRDLSASRVTIEEKHGRVSEAGLALSIKTTQITPDGGPTAVGGLHLIPFGKPYVIALLTVARIGGAGIEERETLARVRESLRLEDGAPR